MEKNVGDQVQVGEILALVEAAEVGRAKTELLQALVQEELQSKIVSRPQAVSSSDVIPERQFQTAQTESVQAKARLFSAQQGLMNLGFAINLDQLAGCPKTHGQSVCERSAFLGTLHSVSALAKPPPTSFRSLAAVASQYPIVPTASRRTHRFAPVREMSVAKSPAGVP